MIRKIFFWVHLSAGVITGLFIFVMAATGVVLSLEKPIVEFIDRDVRSVSAPTEAQSRPLSELLAAARRARMGNPNSIVVGNRPQAATEFTIDRGKTMYLDPYSGAMLGLSSSAAHQFFSEVEKIHRSLGAPLGSKNIGRWLTGVSNLLFGLLILLGVVLWLPRKWSWKSVRAVIVFRTGLRGKAREWNWHNVVGIWCALPLLVISLTGVVMSFNWANALLFRLTGSTLAASGGRGGDRPPRGGESAVTSDPDYDYLMNVAKNLNPNWQTITMNLARDTDAPVSVTVDTGMGGQPQMRTQYVLDRTTGSVLRSNAFADGSLGQRLRAFVRFGHTGEYGGLAGQAIAAIASLGACLLAYTGLSLAIRRLAATLKRSYVARAQKTFADQPLK